MWERIKQIVIKEFLQTLRDKRTRYVIIFPPLLQTIIFGFAVNLDVTTVRLGVMDLDRTHESRKLIDRFAAPASFELVAGATNEYEAQGLLDRGRVQALVRVPAGFGADVARGRQTEIQILVDGANSNTAALVSAYSSAVVASYNRELLTETQLKKLVSRTRYGPVKLSMPGVAAERRVWFNPELLSRNYFVPGVIVNIIMLVTLMLTALSIVREKEIGTMEQIMVTPIRPIELMLGKTIPFALIGMLNMVMITVAALLVFRVPFEGQVLLLVVATALFLLTTLGSGLFLSTLSGTQQQAMMSSFFFFQPAFMLSGFSFPIRNMPEPIQYLTFLNPMRYFMEVVRGVFLKGSGWDILWPQMLAMAVFGVVILTSSAMRFHKRLD
ncbi:MAG TPA: ABC transporter permease [Bryobacteraceae bacterium]|nr:ABC transporter permease [Bryobacteraceae bacterium]HPT27909.1 ABC transporter permease [Bryobacteraceae bacterium]